MNEPTDGYYSPDDTVGTNEEEEEYDRWTDSIPTECYGSPTMDEYSSLCEKWDAGEMERDLNMLLEPHLNVPRNSVCYNQNTVSSVISTTTGPSRKNTTKLMENPNLFARTLSEKLAGPWIEHAFQKRDCVKFIPVTEDSDRCGCGRSASHHSQLALSRFSLYPGRNTLEPGTWSIAEHTQVSKTDAFGTIVFQGGAHAHKAQYVRLGFDSEPEDIMYLMERVWQLPPPRLVITVHGGMSHFEIQDKLGRLFREGLLKAAQTTGAWIITHGVDSGVVRQVAQALDEAGISARMRSRIVTIGIAPWGVLKRREKLIGKEVTVQYDMHTFQSKSGFAVLNDRHSYFLLVDNGTSGRHGAEMKLRKNLETHIAGLSLGHGNRKVPIVCAVLEGGSSTIAAVHQYLTGAPQVPVIVCDGSGRASDVIAFAKRYTHHDGTFPKEVHDQLLTLIATVLPFSGSTPEKLLGMIIECAKQDDLLTVFRFGEDQQEDVDHAILTAILNRQNLSLPDQLALTLAWNRVDVARACLFAAGKAWPTQTLHGAMTDALRLNRVEFVECLLENGVSMKNFLTVARLEQLYNSDQDAVHSVRMLDIEDRSDTVRYLSLPDIGVIIEKLMGSAYKSYYTSRKFKARYERFRMKPALSKMQRFVKKHKKDKSYEESSHTGVEGAISTPEDSPRVAFLKYLKHDDCDFPLPFNDLMIWAILSRRPEMAKCMWTHGEDALAKSLVAIRLYKSISRVAEEEYLELEAAKKLREHAQGFKSESLFLLDHCHRTDSGLTLKLLTATLPHWGQHTVLSMAVLANNKGFLAHQCCQLLLAELWHGDIRLRSRSNLRVLTALLFPPAALTLAYKDSSKEKEKERKKDYYGQFSDNEDSNDETAPLRGATAKKLSMGYQIFKRSIAKGPIGGFGNRNAADPESGTDWGAKKVTFVRDTGGSRKPSMYQSCESFRRPELHLSPLEKMFAFYTAPITKFWAWAVSFHVFLLAFIYSLLIETPLNPTQLEWTLLVYMVAFAMEHCRKLFALGSLNWKERCRVFFGRYWNVFTAIALITFFIGFAFRLNPATRHSYGRSILTISNVLFHMKTLEYMSVHPLLGPYINMAAKMIVAMSYIIVLLLVTLMAFGVARQAITYPHEKWQWILVRNVFYKPYFMLYGEVYAGEIDTCGDEGANCVPGGWIPPVLMTLFLLVANILLINMLIAIFNSIFNSAIEKSQEIWLFERYHSLLEYNDTPLLPPPLTLCALAVRTFKFCCCRCKKNASTAQTRKTGVLDYSMKQILDPEETRRVLDFEEDCMDELMRVKTVREKRDAEMKSKSTVEHAEVFAQKMNEILQENLTLKHRLLEVDSVLEGLAQGQKYIFEMLVKEKKKDTESRRRPVHLSHLNESTQSLPDSVNSELKQKIRDRRAEYTSITDQITMNPEKRGSVLSPLVTRMRSDQTIRKYDDPRFSFSPNLRHRHRLNSSSVSITADLCEMERTILSRRSADDPSPSLREYLRKAGGEDDNEQSL